MKIKLCCTYGVNNGSIDVFYEHIACVVFDGYFGETKFFTSYRCVFSTTVQVEVKPEN